MLLTAGTQETGYNTMTISWGYLGSMWGSPKKKTYRGFSIVCVYVRPQRYTKEFMNREEVFTLCMFDASYKKALRYLGSHSGCNEH